MGVHRGAAWVALAQLHQCGSGPMRPASVWERGTCLDTRCASLAVAPVLYQPSVSVDRAAARDMGEVCMGVAASDMCVPVQACLAVLSMP